MQVASATISGALASNATNETSTRRAFETMKATREMTIERATAICR